MMIFPASPGTQVIQRERGKKEATLVPVVGWYHVQGTLAFPICPMPHGGLTRGRAIITPDGFVTDPSYGVVCGDRDEWMALTKTDAYWDAKGSLYDKMQEPPAPKPQRPLTDAENAESGQPENLKITEGGIVVGTSKRIPDRPRRERAYRQFKTNSWWKTRDPKTKAVMQIDGGDLVPHEDDPTWEKIGIVDFKALKKQGWTVTDEWGTPAAAGDDEDLI